MTEWDVVVLGSGPAGCATALALLREGVSRVCLVAPHRSEIRIGETIPPDTRIPLQQLGLWERFLSEEHERCLGSCSAWGSDIVGYNDFVLHAYGHGWHLDRRRFDEFLLQAAGAAGVTVLQGSRFLDCQPAEGGGFRLRLVNRDRTNLSLAARFVVDATGPRGAFARCLGAKHSVLDHLVVIYGFFDSSGGTSRSLLTMLEATRNGWWYAASLPGGKSAVAFASDPETVKEDQMTKLDHWLPDLLRTKQVAPRLAGCHLIPNSLAVRLAPSFLLQPVGGEDWLAVGDAAAAYDPLSSQGIHKALTDGLEAASVIAMKLMAGVDQASMYQTNLVARFDEYRENRNYFYSLEGRWPMSPFWKRRKEHVELRVA